MTSIKDIFHSYAEFDSQGRHTNGTDKESNHHYGDAYERIFSERPGGIFHRSTRGDVKLMMEIGVADGSSLLAWREVFPNALIVGMDIHHSDKAHGERIEFHLGDQRSQEDCELVARCYANMNESGSGFGLFDVIVEDATHRIENTLLTLYWMWPFVRPGGLYIVEEWDGVDRDRIQMLWPNAEIVDTTGPSGGVEPLVVFRKPIHARS